MKNMFFPLFLFKINNTYFRPCGIFFPLLFGSLSSIFDSWAFPPYWETLPLTVFGSFFSIPFPVSILHSVPTVFFSLFLPFVSICFSLKQSLRWLELSHYLTFSLLFVNNLFAFWHDITKGKSRSWLCFCWRLKGLFGQIFTFDFWILTQFWIGFFPADWLFPIITSPFFLVLFPIKVSFTV